MEHESMGAPPQSRKREFQGEGKRRYNNRKRHRAVPKPAEIPICSVCSTVEHPKYKCPKCRSTYCSIACCRKHKEDCKPMVEKETATVVPASSNTPECSSRYLPNSATISFSEYKNRRREQKEREGDDIDDDDDLDSGWKVEQGALEKLHGSEWLRTELSDSGLRQLILKIVSASKTLDKNLETEQERVLAQAKADHPLLKRFLDKLLVLTGVLHRQREDLDIDLGTWLESSNNNDAHPLILQSLERFRRNNSSSSDSDTSSTNDSDTSSSGDSDSDANSQESGSVRETTKKELSF